MQKTLYKIACVLLTTILITLNFGLSIYKNTFKENKRMRAREAGVEIGILKPGQNNAITDVAGVRVGQVTLIAGDSIRTGVTAIIPQPGNLFRNKLPAAIYVGNGFGKLIGFTQVDELGEIESPILLTNTLNVSRVADALISYMLGLPGNEDVRSINVVVGETNDGYLNDIRGRHVGPENVEKAIRNATSGPVEEGSIGAGTGTRCLGFKGGIGTSSRILPADLGGYTVGVLVQSNYGGLLQINGAPVGRELEKIPYNRYLPYPGGDGSIMIVVATDAPLSSRNLKRLAKRAMLGIARTGGYSSNGSGDYIIAFSTLSKATRDSAEQHSGGARVLSNHEMSPLFLAVVEATEEAIINSLFMATTVTGRNGNITEALPLDETIAILKKYNALHHNSDLPSWRQ
jgi:D-aminopeptidase